MFEDNILTLHETVFQNEKKGNGNNACKIKTNTANIRSRKSWKGCGLQYSRIMYFVVTVSCHGVYSCKVIGSTFMLTNVTVYGWKTPLTVQSTLSNKLGRPLLIRSIGLRQTIIPELP